MSYLYIQKMYGVEFRLGQRVQSEEGKYHGVIKSNSRGEHYAYVQIDGRNHSSPFHPLDLMPELEAKPND